MPLRLDHAAPVLPAVNYNRSLTFFKALGFDITEYDKYAVMRLDGADIHLQATTNRALSENATCYLYVGNVDMFYTIALSLGAKGLQPPAETERGARECLVADPSGILLRVGTPRKKPRAIGRQG